MDSQNVSQSATQLADLGHNDQFKPLDGRYFRQRLQMIRDRKLPITTKVFAKHILVRIKF